MAWPPAAHKEEARASHATLRTLPHSASTNLLQECINGVCRCRKSRSGSCGEGAVAWHAWFGLGAARGRRTQWLQRCDSQPMLGRTAKQMTCRRTRHPATMARCRLPPVLFTSLAHQNVTPKTRQFAHSLHSPPSSMPRSCGVLFFSTRSPSYTNRTAGWRGSGVARCCPILALQLSAAVSGCPKGCPRSITGYLALHAGRAHLGRGPRSSLNRTH